MKILGLFNNECAAELFQWLSETGHEVILSSEKLSSQWCKEQGFDLTVSYTYRYILSSEIIHALNDNVVNIHNSMLPFNRGADPNIWSIADKTPRGVTLHYINEKLDSGYVIAQEFVRYGDNETLESSYFILDRAAKEMFKKAFAYYDYWPELKKQCIGSGTYHSIKDGAEIKKQISTYDISIDEFRAILSENNN